MGEAEVDADQLLANPHNWRIHPKNQQDALTGVLDQVGWVQRVIVNQRTGFVVDGHARVALSISRGEKVPVVYVDLSEQEEALVLATLDPIAAMAGKDDDILRSLVSDIGDIGVMAIDDLLGGMSSGESSDGIFGDGEAGGSSPQITAKLSIPPQGWLTMRDDIIRAVESVCSGYGIKAQWPG